MSEEIELEVCKGCGNQPVRGGVLFMGYHIECCTCGICIPFPPARTAEAAALEWNKAQVGEE